MPSGSPSLLFSPSYSLAMGAGGSPTRSGCWPDVAKRAVFFFVGPSVAGAAAAAGAEAESIVSVAAAALLLLLLLAAAAAGASDPESPPCCSSCMATLVSAAPDFNRAAAFTAVVNLSASALSSTCSSARETIGASAGAVAVGKVAPSACALRC